MPPETIRVAAEQEDDRYSRLRLIPWWDQEKIRATNVLVVGRERWATKFSRTWRCWGSCAWS
jgi:hypothetical protein